MNVKDDDIKLTAWEKVAARAMTLFSVAAALSIALFFCGGCALERADPAARSNRAIYTITVTAHGDSSTASAYITDGLMATADGEGAITQPTTQTTTQNPEFSGGLDPVTAGINAVAGVAREGIKAYATGKKDAGCKDCEPGAGASDGCEGGACTPDGEVCEDCDAE